MADLVTRLLLDDKQFNNNIQRSKQQMQTFQNVGKNVMTTMTKFAGAIGAATTAAEAFNKIIAGSQTATDTYEQVMRVATTSVDNFFSSLSTGDFSYFNQGLDSIITKAKDAQAALDALGNATMSYGYFNRKNSADLQEALNAAKDESLPKADRDAARKTAEAIIGKQEEITTQLNKSVTNAVQSLMTESNALLKGQVSTLDLEDILKLDITAAGEENKKKLEAQYNDYIKIYNSKVREFSTVQNQSTQFGVISNQVTDYDKVAKAMEQYNEQYKQAILYNTVLVKKSDAWLQDLINTANAGDEATRSLESMRKSVIRLNNTELKKTSSNVQKITPTVEIPKGSIADLNNQIKELKAQFDLEVNPASRMAIQKEIKALEEKKHYIEIEYKIANDFKVSDIDTSKILGTDLQIKPFEFKNPITKSDSNIVENYTSSLAALGSMMGVFNGIVDDSTAGWLQWGAGLVSSVSTAIMSLYQLNGANQAMALSEAIKNAAAMPFPLNLAAIGTSVATVLAAIAAIPAFADGGIFQSALTTGDRNLARLNGGEMILNKGQQANLFNLLDKGTPLNSGGNVTFKIRGQELVGILNNYNNKISKVK